MITPRCNLYKELYGAYYGETKKHILDNLGRRAFPFTYAQANLYRKVSGSTGVVDAGVEMHFSLEGLD